MKTNAQRPPVERTYNRDAERFLEKARLAKQQQQELDEMDASFDQTDTDSDFRRVTQGI